MSPLLSSSNIEGIEASLLPMLLSMCVDLYMVNMQGLLHLFAFNLVFKASLEIDPNLLDASLPKSILVDDSYRVWI